MKTFNLTDRRRRVIYKTMLKLINKHERTINAPSIFLCHEIKEFLEQHYKIDDISAYNLVEARFKYFPELACRITGKGSIVYWDDNKERIVALTEAIAELETKLSKK